MSAADYPYDEGACAEQLDGLDRLRTLPDRRLAEYLYVLYVQAVRNSGGDVDTRVRRPARLDALRRTALRALAGELGTDARELAVYVLLDDAGREHLNYEQLRIFADRLRELQSGRR